MRDQDDRLRPGTSAELPLVPVPALAGVTAYRTPVHGAPIDLHLDGNEGAVPPADLLRGLGDLGSEAMRRYPDARALEARLAERFGLDPSSVLVTAGGDDALERACRAVLTAGREMILPVPGFEMLGRFGRLAGAAVVTVPWAEGPYPLSEVLAAIAPATAAIAVVSPNNPTGAVATADDLRVIAEAAPGALLLVDLAYVEFADEDLTDVALSLPNAVVVRTLSKAWGMAGLRVGYALGPARVLAWMRAAGLPYAVARPSLALAGAWMDRGGEAMAAFVARVRNERDRLAALACTLGARTQPSQANFVLVRHSRIGWLRDGLAGLGIAVRTFPDHPDLADAARVTCPGDDAAFARLAHGLRSVLSPQALLFDMDGVLADVSGSYRRAIRETAASFGVALRDDEVAAAKRGLDANNDWIVTHRLLAARGVDASLAHVTERFEAHVQGTDGVPGLWAEERAIVSRGLLERLAARLPLGIVTGRPRLDAERFLAQAGFADLFGTIVCMEDGPCKPDPAPVRLALERLGVERAWMVGDTPDDVRAARAAGVVPIGVVTPGEDPGHGAAALIEAGAARVLGDPVDLEEWLS